MNVFIRFKHGDMLRKMSDDNNSVSADVPGAAPGKDLTPEARRALEEAHLRRQKEAAALPPEEGGPKGLEPTRYGDWERKGIASDF